MDIILQRLRELRQAYDLQPVLDSRRIFHGRGHCFTGLEFVSVDFFQSLLLLTCFSEPPAAWIETFIEKISPLLSPMITGVVVQYRYLSGAPSITVWGEMPADVYARRGDLRFALVLAQQNVGYFLDMEPGRAWLEEHATNRRILNLFAYTCAFSVVAISAGAKQVVNVDMSRRSLERGRQNHVVNQLNREASVFLAEDIMKSWGRIKRRGPYDLLVIDPPSYQPGSFIAQKDYVKVLRRIPELMPGGGLVLACLNAPELGADFLADMIAANCPNCSVPERLVPSEDFPDIDADRQLKLLIFSYQPPRQ